MNFKDIKEYTSETFGRCVRERRTELGLSVRGLAEKIGMSPVYLSDIERGNRNAPTSSSTKNDYLSKLIAELKLDKDEIPAFYDMAAASNGNYSDISSYLNKNQSCRLALRLANEGDVPDEVWQEFVDRLLELNSSTESEGK
ncbi:MAG: helix-turn-helix domain-containing protein [Blautia sp.]|nr:helix-turn-helix domain-containing protein [Blautia sp.]